jgi:hypothetical protein
VVRELAALHGGRVWVGDAPPRSGRAGAEAGAGAGAGAGARFVIELPLAPEGGRTPDGTAAAGGAGGAGGAEGAAGAGAAA